VLVGLIVTISQNSIGNAITELLGVVVKRTPNTEGYEQSEPALIVKKSSSLMYLITVAHSLVRYLTLLYCWLVLEH
jgi:hypothetical protein